MSSYAKVRDARLRDPSVHFWLKDAIRTLEQKDILDVMHDLGDLQQIFARRYEEITGREWQPVNT